jgi:hypothetical protein
LLWRRFLKADIGNVAQRFESADNCNAELLDYILDRARSKAYWKTRSTLLLQSGITHLHPTPEHGRGSLEKELATAIRDHTKLVDAIIPGIPAEQVKDKMQSLIRKGPPAGSWLAKMLARKPRMLVARETPFKSMKGWNPTSRNNKECGIERTLTDHSANRRVGMSKFLIGPTKRSARNIAPDKHG